MDAIALVFDNELPILDDFDICAMFSQLLLSLKPSMDETGVEEVSEEALIQNFVRLGAPGDYEAGGDARLTAPFLKETALKYRQHCQPIEDKLRGADGRTRIH